MNPQELQMGLFAVPTAEKSKNRRRTRSVSTAGDSNITSRGDHIAKRNKVLTARYYYYTELCRIREDDVRKILSDNEFFVEDRTIYNALVAEDAFYSSLLRERATRARLKKMFPGFDWN